MIVFYNPHTQMIFGRTVLDYMLGVKGYSKYLYLLRHLINNNEKFSILIDGCDSALPKYLSFFVPPRIEIFLWSKINNIDYKKLNIITDISKITNKDVFFAFGLRNLDKKNGNNIANIKNKKFLKIFHITHFVQNSSLIAKNVETNKIDYLVAECNLYKNSEYFRKIFTKYKKDVYCLPFVFQDRFKKLTPFNKRKNKCLATGTIVDITETGNPQQFEDFQKHFNVRVLQPIREQIFLNKMKLRREIDCRISKLYEIKLKKKSNIITAIPNKIFNTLFANNANKRSYFKFNIVEEYNKYKMFINGEEVNDLPGIGFVEGMACGCAYIGQRSSIYADMGMIPEVHYISYDGTIDDLKRTVRYYQSHPKKLEKIAQAGYQFATKKFCSKNVAKTFFEDLKKISENFIANKFKTENLEFKSSFTEDI